MLILIITIIAAVITRLFMYNRAEHCLHTKNMNIESQK